MFLGDGTGTNITAGGDNAVIGFKAAEQLTEGRFNTIIGFKAAQNMTTSLSNTIIGREAGKNSTGSQNVLIGRQAGENALGGENTAIGDRAGLGITSGSSITLIGKNANVSNGTLTNATAIGANASVGQDNSVVLGNNAKVGIGTSAPAYDLDIVGDINFTGAIYQNGFPFSGGGGVTGPTGPVGPQGIQGPTGPAGGFTLDQAYDNGGQGAGRTIVADSGAVHIGGEDGLMIDCQLGVGDTISWDQVTAQDAMFFNPHKMAFRVGFADLEDWVHYNLGNYSTAFGNRTLATGNNSFCAGFNGEASGESSAVFGYAGTASGINSMAIGYEGLASGYCSFTSGYQTLASGWMSSSFGEGTSAPSYGEISVGLYNTSYLPYGSTSIELDDRVFTVGNGTNDANRADAMVILKNGMTGIGSSTPEELLHLESDSSKTTLKVIAGNPSDTSSLQLYEAEDYGFEFEYDGFWDQLDLWSRKFSGNEAPRMTWQKNGDVGIGNNSPAFQLHLGLNSAAKPASSAWTVASDQRLKTDVREFTDGLNVIDKIDPVWFTYNGKAGMPEETGVGTIAQELQEIAPYMVNNWIHEDKEGNSQEYLGVDYGAMDFVLINAIKEQQEQIALLQSQNEDLQDMIQEILENQNRFDSDLQQCCFNYDQGTSDKGQGIDVGTLSGVEGSDAPILEQNAPNPFRENSVIKYYLPTSSRSAELVITDNSGIQLKAFNLQGKGFGQVMISGGSFKSGTYIYTLIINGERVASKQMILL